MKKKKLTLTNKIFIGLGAGLALGVILNLWVPNGYVRDVILVDGVLNIVGQGFIKLMKMLVVPLVLCSLVCGTTSLNDTRTLGKIGGRTLIFYLSTTVIAVAVAICTALVIRPGVGLDMSKVMTGEVEKADKVSMADTILDIIPDNPFGALAEGSMLQVILFAVILGIILAKRADPDSIIIKFFREANDVMMDMTWLVMQVAPLGVFCMIAKTFANLGFGAFLPLLKYMGCVILGLIIQCFGVYMIMLFVFTRVNPFKFIKKTFNVMAFAISTSSSNAVIPMNIDNLYKKVGVSKSVSSFTIPFGATINMDGTSIMQGVAVIFAAQAYGVHLGIGGYLTVIATATLASIGTAAIPSVGLVTLTMVFSSVGLPVDAIAIIMGIDRILDMMRTSVNITGDAVCTTIVADSMGEFDRDVYNDKVNRNV